MSHIAARQKIVYYMIQHKVDIMILLETHINTNSKEMHDGCTFVFSTNITEKDIQENNKRLEEKRRRKKTTNMNNDEKEQEQIEWMNINKIAMEKLGTAVVYSPKIAKRTQDIIQHSNRMISIILNTKIGTFTITGVHMPHAGDSMLNKKKAYHALDEVEKTYSRGCNIHMIGEDFHARIITRVPAEHTYIGPHIYNPDEATFDKSSNGQLEIREMFLDFCSENNFAIMNTWFQKTQDKLVTYRSPKENIFNTQLNTNNFGQIDHILAKHKWKNEVTDSEASDLMPVRIRP